MCLASCNFSLQWEDEEDDFVGYGYKAYPPISAFDSLGRINSSKKHRGISLSKNWSESKGHKYLDDSQTIRTTDNNRYYPGFHILLTRAHAEDYHKYCSGDFFSGAKIAMVKFKNVVCYGKQYCGTKSLDVPCIIAKHMKIVELY